MTTGSPSTLIRDVRVFDGERTRQGLSVLIRGGIIGDIGVAVTPPPGCLIVDGTGRTLLPGLIDAHTHAVSAEDLGQAWVFGVCTKLDMFCSPTLVARLKSAADSRDDLADLRSAGTGASVLRRCRP